MQRKPSKVAFALRNGVTSFSPTSYGSKKGFSLLELLVVMVIMVTLMAISGPALSGLKSNRDFGNSVITVAETLERARAHAMAHNTYVWVGFYEENASDSQPTTSLPPYSGTGKVVLSIVASTDGTRIFEDSAAPAALPDARVRPVTKLIVLNNLHLADVGSLSGGGSPLRLQGRPDLAYTDPEAEQCRISSTSSDKTDFPLSAYGYTFYKTIRFSPTGEASINGTYQPKRIGEIGLMPAHGDTVTDGQADVAAIQFSGIGGNIQIFRQ